MINTTNRLSDQIDNWITPITIGKVSDGKKYPPSLSSVKTRGTVKRSAMFLLLRFISPQAGCALGSHALQRPLACLASRFVSQELPLNANQLSARALTTKSVVWSLVLLLYVSRVLFPFFFPASHPQQLHTDSPEKNAFVTLPVSQSPVVEKEVLVKFKPTVSQALIGQKLREYRATIIRTNKDIELTVLAVPKGQENIIIQKLQQDGIADYAQRDHYLTHRSLHLTHRSLPNDPGYSQQWDLPLIHVPQAWGITKGAGVKVGIDDSGYDPTHPDLGDSIINSKNFVGDGNMNDTMDHGSHVEGIISAATNNKIGIAAVCPACQIIFAKTGNDNQETDALDASALTWLTDQGAKVINMSSGSNTQSQPLIDAVNYVWRKGSILVAAVNEQKGSTPCTAQNNQTDYPSMDPNVVGVTATDKADTKPAWACGGRYVSLAAPGVGIYTLSNKGAYENADGTSFAAPIVAGVAALVWSTKYGTSNAAVVHHLCDTADKISGTGAQFKCGRINAYAAVKEVPG